MIHFATGPPPHPQQLTIKVYLGGGGSLTRRRAILITIEGDFREMSASSMPASSTGQKIQREIDYFWLF